MRRAAAILSTALLLGTTALAPRPAHAFLDSIAGGLFGGGGGGGSSCGSDGALLDAIKGLGNMVGAALGVPGVGSAVGSVAGSVGDAATGSAGLVEGEAGAGVPGPWCETEPFAAQRRLTEVRDDVRKILWGSDFSTAGDVSRVVDGAAGIFGTINGVGQGPEEAERVYYEVYAPELPEMMTPEEVASHHAALDADGEAAALGLRRQAGSVASGLGDFARRLTEIGDASHASEGLRGAQQVATQAALVGLEGDAQRAALLAAMANADAAERDRARADRALTGRVMKYNLSCLGTGGAC